MKALVIGAGAQGGPCSSILAKQESVTTILLGDVNIEIANKVKETLNSDKIKAISLNAKDPESIVKAVEETGHRVDVVIDFTPAVFSVYVMKAAVKLNAHYVNSAASDEHLYSFIKNEPLMFDNELKANKCSAVLGCGALPGIVNVLARHYCDKLETVKSLKIRVGASDPYEGQTIKKWNPSWSPAQQLFDFSDPPIVFIDKKYEQMPLFAEPEEYDFGKVLGKVLVTHHSHDESYTLPKVIGKGMEYCDFKYPFEPVIATFIASGLASDEEINVKGVMVKPRDVLLAVTPNPGEVSIMDKDAQKQFLPIMLLSRIHIIIEGTIEGGKKKTYKIETLALYDQGAEALELFGTAMISVPFSAVTAAMMVTEGYGKPGVMWPEELNPEKYFKTMERMGLKLNWEEL